MILYKYMSFEAAIAVIENQSIGFSCLEDLNDPFECTAFGFADDEDSKITANLAAYACKNKFSRNYGVLSLTRQPLNSLMWSHYGDEHQGVVLGIDVDIAGLSNPEKCVIPSQCGEVIYSATKPHRNLSIISEDSLRTIGKELVFDTEAFNLVKRAFLYKSIEWGYEEEVRVVKNISEIPFCYHSGQGRHNKWTKISVSGRPLYCFDIPDSAIKEIYLGRHIYKNVTKKNAFTDQELKNILKSWGGKDIKLMQCHPDIHSWQLIAEQSINKS
ncbi:DUF2971 domain-containing protein [Oceanisphaera arctica]|uniref:DUF2971 domain-containing protein n=1 Tax=Oceanisphaera arctica TaxID=641510 RepID=A0A2P5TQR8_9GAMM|nr:DUF2971 domain-containing protein [Oceanisphaera arctica]PPL18065.1 hypothetical protein UN63_02580 [Oceanisphaera arctica]GHA09567.1 hypothetical protein GCM10007082_08120 [Oceanisphaera arctica]